MQCHEFYIMAGLSDKYVSNNTQIILLVSVYCNTECTIILHRVKSLTNTLSGS